MVWSCFVRSGGALQVVCGWSWHGLVMRSFEWLGSAGEAMPGLVRQGAVWHGRAWWCEVRFVQVWYSIAGDVVSGVVGWGQVRRCTVLLVAVRQCRLGEVRSGSVQ